ncbi:MAG: flagellar biosynthetic protein FliQ [Alphaproteobacteria bacterium]|nr:flagellar biosynthetic protein FliQ [Alphaproteobacteria bacterium]
MEQQEIIDLIRETIWITLELGTPVMMIGLVVGVSVALIQALTQVQEITLVFVPKIISIFIAIAVFLPSFVLTLIAFMERIADKIIGIG